MQEKVISMEAENCTKNNIEIIKPDDNVPTRVFKKWVCLVDKSGPAMAEPAGTAPMPLLLLNP